MGRQALGVQYREGEQVGPGKQGKQEEESRGEGSLPEK